MVVGVEEDEVDKETMQGLMHCAKRLWFRQEGKRRTRLISERSTKARGNTTTTSECKLKKTMAAMSADAMRMMP